MNNLWMAEQPGMGMAAALAALGLVCLGLAIGMTMKAAGTMKKLEVMLEAALNGRTVPQHYDENRLSRLESRLSRFLSSHCQVQNRLEESQRHLHALIGDISHQTKTPLANMRMYTELLLEHRELPAACRPLAEQTGRQAEKLVFLLQSLINLSRLENGILQLSPRAHSVAFLLQQTAEEWQGKAQAKGIMLTCSPPDDSLRACFDLKWTLEALHNLMDNALKYTSPEGRITLSAASYEMFVRISVTDTGIGIPENEQPRIFARFYRSPAVQDREGAGLGLFLARNIIMSEGGYITVESEPGQGAVFSVFLPRHANREAETAGALS